VRRRSALTSSRIASACIFCCRIREKALDYGEGWFIVADTKVRNRMSAPNSGEAIAVPFLAVVKI
jgi:hypothetical protein